MRISDWSSDVCSSDLLGRHVAGRHGGLARGVPAQRAPLAVAREEAVLGAAGIVDHQPGRVGVAAEVVPVDLLGLQQLVHQGQHEEAVGAGPEADPLVGDRSEEHTSELQSLMRISYAVFCLKKKKHSTK